jgi:hypothetical protein
MVLKTRYIGPLFIIELNIRSPVASSLDVDRWIRLASQVRVVVKEDSDIVASPSITSSMKYSKHVDSLKFKFISEYFQIISHA